MSKVLCTVLDVKAEVFNPPVVFESANDAKRAFFDACSDTNTMLGRHPEDFKMFMVGEFDVCTGVLGLVDRVAVTDGLEFLMEKKQNGD